MVLRLPLSVLKRATNLLIYASVLFGILLLLQLWLLVPRWLFYSVLIGWFAYLITAFAVARRYEKAYSVVLVLAIITLAVSLPQPAHFGFLNNIITLAALTFIIGSILQMAIIVMILAQFLRTRINR